MKTSLYFLISILVFTSLFNVHAEEMSIEISEGSELEQSLAEDAYRTVISWYSELGFHIDIDVPSKVLVQDVINAEGRQAPEAFGLYNPETNQIHLVGYRSDIFQNGNFLGSEPCEDLYMSLIVHELTHFSNARLQPEMSPAFDELVAATVQFETMEPSLRTRVIEGASPLSFSSVSEITLSRYWDSPIGFLVGAYLFSQRLPVFVKNLLNGRGPKLKDPLFVEWSD